ncbi:GNAT family N-acetyltransferase [Pseudomonas sp. LS1212]|uniref:GNAT family N-acetyltransferase n=1 Tax=Pseudomonas sp. LS1212 TaxID=2972478 RepID=UPI00215D0E1A|nr:GNAT family N-acetyltransferase [Pseudomonas sp. LS1212]UVJ42367.1 GNAT family N-acetyltransferase [Pseudomonas sp. LS1212]
MHPPNPDVSIRVADDSFTDYILDSEFGFSVGGYAIAALDKRVENWAVEQVEPYRKCYGIDPEEFRSYRDSADSAVFMAYLQGKAVGHVVVSTNWNGLAHIDELAVDAAARRCGVARALLDVACFWSRKKQLPGVMLETQNNNLGACRLYQDYGFVLGGIDRMRYRGIDSETEEVALFWYLMF